MFNIKNKNLIFSCIIVLFICLLFFIFKGNTTKLSKDESVEMNGYKISYNDYPTEYKNKVRVHMRIENLKNKDNPIKPSETIKLITDGKEAEMVEFANDKGYIESTSFSPRMTVTLDIIYKIKGNPKSYKLQFRDKKLLKDKVYEYDITPDISKVN
ncbi:hypothetical protein [Staphylococcus aureus]|uniref:hypothetical protein n=1 Tax=Staphylococcus aureus TaxID=1280 RepID=UPI00208E0FAD|nr:hypothetical protein [Staphylococcus aureus]MCO4439873.1 hypothetical protein [Staphylococcus aureus]MCO4444103.1 hypothetical protein [Staphylococcus aureus]UXT54669.1 hypothetical protein MUA45_00155 [Staphylococcus aureus]UXU02487.1 hypothetical protein MUA10_00155 [Staphylococcus aureus]UXV50362.1 hypothetical protein MUA55_00155 [Staphylococcus aureus]